MNQAGVERERSSSTTPSVYIINGVVAGCGTAIVIDNAAAVVDGLEIIGSNVGIDVSNGGSLQGRRIVHNP